LFSTIDHIGGAVFVRIRRWSLKLRNKPDLSFVESNLIVGGYCSIELLANSGIQAIVDMREESQDCQNDLKKFKINYLQIKVTDRNVPDILDIRQGIHWIKSNIENGNTVFVHCNLGRGRGPLMVCSYLIANGIESKEAIKTIKKIRKYTYFNKKQLKWIRVLSQNL
jgi:protein tyrosine phosphatase